MTDMNRLLYAAVKLLSVAVLQYCVNSTTDTKMMTRVGKDIGELMTRLDAKLSKED